MTNLEEIQELLRLHIATQDVPRAAFLSTLNGIRSEAGSAPGSWVYEWSRLAETSLSRGALLDAVQAFNFARFPFVDGEGRRTALARCVSTFQTWIDQSGCGVARRWVSFQGERIPIYVAGTPSADVPLVVVMGGIVSLKEQWHRILLDGPKLGFAVAVADFPGVGENPLRYGPESYRYLGALLDSFGAPDLRAIVVGISFAGHLALRQAACDQRIRGLVVTGSPVRRFFTDLEWLRGVPETTTRTLCHLTGADPEALPALLGELPLSTRELASLQIPVHAVVSERDEIIPPEDAALLRQHVAKFRALSLKDVHGSPRYIGAIRKYIAYSLVSMAFPRKRVLASLLRCLASLEVAKAKLRNGFVRSADPAPRAFGPAVRVGAPGVSEQ